MIRVFLLLVTLFTTLDASIIKRPPAKVADISYKDLVCSEEDQANIYEIISTVGEKPKLKLLFHINHLKELEAKVTHVHPLKFLSTIFKNSYLKSLMYYIWNDSYKKEGFFNGLSPRLTLEAEKGKLDMHLKDFATDLGVSPESLKAYFDVRDWENMVLFLIQS